ncbi:SURF1 family protein [Aliiroseovarius sp. CAU 1755]
MRIRLIVTAVLSILVLAVFVGLGNWQLDRLAWKEAVLAQIEAQISAPPVPLPEDPDPIRDKYLPVIVRGNVNPEELHVLVSSRDYGAGFRIIQPFTLANTGQRIMIDRGFVPVGDKLKLRSGGDMTVTGNLHWPDERDDYTPANDAAKNYWYAREVEVLAEALDTDPILVVAASSTDPDILPMRVTTEGIPNDHLEYAMTWFLMAATWVMMTGFALWRMKRRTRDTRTPRNN